MEPSALYDMGSIQTGLGYLITGKWLSSAYPLSITYCLTMLAFIQPT